MIVLSQNGGPSGEWDNIGMFDFLVEGLHHFDYFASDRGTISVLCKCKDFLWEEVALK